MDANANYMDDFEKVYEESESTSNGGGGGGGYTEYQMCDHQESHRVVRLIGAPRMIQRAWVKNGADKKVPISYSKNSIFDKMVKAVLKFDWDNKGTEKEPKWERKFVNEGKIGPIFDLVHKNNESNGMDAGWEGGTFYPFNCIDRHDDWCAVNKHTKLLVKSNYDIGVSPQVFKAIKDQVVADYGPYQDYDIDVRRVEGSDNRIGYTAAKAQADMPAISEFIKQGPLTPEEQAYETYDLDEVAKDSPAGFILWHLKDDIKKIDGVLGTKFFDEFTAQAETEPKFEKAQKSEDSSTGERKLVPSGMKTADGFSLEDMISAGWNYDQLWENNAYRVLLKEEVVPQKSAAPATPPPQAAPTPAPTPAPVVEEPKVDGFTLADMKAAGWNEDQLAADPKWSALLPKKEEPVAATPPPATPAPQAAPAPATPPATPAPQAAGTNAVSLPCTNCGTPFPISEPKCPNCGYEENIKV